MEGAAIALISLLSLHYPYICVFFSVKCGPFLFSSTYNDCPSRPSNDPLSMAIRSSCPPGVFQGIKPAAPTGMRNLTSDAATPIITRGSEVAHITAVA